MEEAPQEEVKQYYLKEFFAKINKVIKKNNISTQKAFNAFDTDNDGKISGNELISAIKIMKLDYTQDEENTMMEFFEKELNGGLNFDEFIQALDGNLGEKEEDKKEKKSSSKRRKFFLI